MKDLKVTLKKLKRKKKMQANLIHKGKENKPNFDTNNHSTGNTKDVSDTYLCEINPCEFEVNTSKKATSTTTTGVVLESGTTHHIMDNPNLIHD